MSKNERKTVRFAMALFVICEAIAIATFICFKLLRV
jgi:hypothetical protein